MTALDMFPQFGVREGGREGRRKGGREGGRRATAALPIPASSSPPPSPPAWGWGDPHITTLDDFSYTFNGFGEYVLLSSGDFLLQARMAPYPGTMATQFVAFSVGTEADDSVEVNCNHGNHMYTHVSVCAQMRCVCV